MTSLKIYTKPTGQLLLSCDMLWHSDRLRYKSRCWEAIKKRLHSLPESILLYCIVFSDIMIMMHVSCGMWHVIYRLCSQVNNKNMLCCCDTRLPAASYSLDDPWVWPLTLYKPCEVHVCVIIRVSSCKCHGYGSLCAPTHSACFGNKRPIYSDAADCWKLNLIFIIGSLL